MASGSDADGVTLTLPTELQIGRELKPKASGPLKMSGFGDNLEFTFDTDGAIDEFGNAILLPFKKPGADLEDHPQQLAPVHSAVGPADGGFPTGVGTAPLIDSRR